MELVRVHCERYSSMSPTLSKEEAERRIFEALAPLVGLEIVPDSLCQRLPPAPDIECETKGSGPMAFELLALDAPHTRARLANMYATQEAWDRALAARPEPEKDRLVTECADLYLSVSIEEWAGSRARKKMMALIQDRLLGLPAAYSGELFESELEMPPGVHSASVSRGPLRNGPRIIAPSAGHCLPPQVDKIREKLIDKTYQTGAPLELFAYAEHDEVDAHIDSLPAMEQCVKAHLPGSKFQRVSIFNLHFRQLVYRFPEELK
jgi:hypothetical protein